MRYAGVDQRCKLVFGFEFHVKNVVGDVNQLEDLNLLAVLEVFLYSDGHVHVCLLHFGFYFENYVI